jgi:hypothetical protein
VVVEERGLVVEVLLPRGEVGPARPSGEPLRVVEVSMPASALMP